MDGWHSMFCQQHKIAVGVFLQLQPATANSSKVCRAVSEAISLTSFNMFQFSIYLRHCASRENAEVHIQRVKKILPEKGHVGIMCVTDKQFGMMEIFRGKKLAEPPDTVQQLELF